MANEQALILRDGTGNYYVISSDVIGQSQVSDQQKTALEEALKGDVSGFLFDAALLSNITNLAQTNNASANNVGVGFFVGPQTIAQIQGNSANIGTVQSANP
jgi:hypothetical protein